MFLMGASLGLLSSCLSLSRGGWLALPLIFSVVLSLLAVRAWKLFFCSVLLIFALILWLFHPQISLSNALRKHKSIWWRYSVEVSVQKRHHLIRGFICGLDAFWGGVCCYVCGCWCCACFVCNGVRFNANFYGAHQWRHSLYILFGNYCGLLSCFRKAMFCAYSLSAGGG